LGILLIWFQTIAGCVNNFQQPPLPWLNWNSQQLNYSKRIIIRREKRKQERRQDEEGGRPWVINGGPKVFTNLRVFESFLCSLFPSL
jgi:hypothetical protein